MARSKNMHRRVIPMYNGGVSPITTLIEYYLSLATQKTLGVIMRSNTPFYVLIGLLLSFCLQANVVSAIEKINCEQQFEELIKVGDPLDAQDKVNRMEGLSSTCKGTGIYEARLAKLYSIAGQREKALKTLQKALRARLAYTKELKITLFDTLFVLERAGEAEKIAQELIKDYPSWHGGYLSMAQIALVGNNNKDAISYLEKAAELEESSNIYLLMVMAFYQEKRYRESALSMQKVLKLNRDSILHTQAVCSAAYSLVALGYLAEAEDLLTKHIEFTPKAKNDPMYKEAIEVIHKMKAS